jgi:hypothetical protein
VLINFYICDGLRLLVKPLDGLRLLVKPLDGEEAIRRVRLDKKTTHTLRLHKKLHLRYFKVSSFKPVDWWPARRKLRRKSRR